MRQHNQYTVTTALHADTRFVVEAARILYKRQTMDERDTGMSVHVNVLGFNRADSETMTAIVELWDVGAYTQVSLDIARQRCLKYSRQLADHANGEHVDFGAHGWEALNLR